MNVSDYLAKFLAEKQVPAVFELVGGMTTFMLDSIHRHGKTRIVSMHHEQGAAFAAEAVGRMTNSPCVAMATSGPGATNLLTGIGSCYYDSTPAVFITGQVNRFERKGNRAVRQLGFQETDIVRIVQPIVKRGWSVDDPNQVPHILEEAFRTATTGRPGPVLIDIPMDVQRAQVDLSVGATIEVEAETVKNLSNTTTQAIKEALLTAKRPMVLAGAGVRLAKAICEFRALIEIAKVPVVHSLMAVDVLPSDHALNAGMIGSYGNRWSNLAISRSDLLVVLGSRLDVRQTGADTENFKTGKEIFHIDCDAAEINNRITGCHAIQSDLRSTIVTLAEVLAPNAERFTCQFESWRAEVAQLRHEWPDVNELQNLEGINPNQFMHQLAYANPGAQAYVVDVGQHQMWAAQSIDIRDSQRFLTSGGMGSMGFALPAAIGVAVAQPSQPVVMIAGDGAFQCNIQELQTVARLRLPVKMVVVNNQCLGMVRQFQETYFESRYQSTIWGYSAPDFAAVAAAFGIPSFTVADPTGVHDAVKWLSSDTQGPALLQVMISPFANAYPKLAFGQGMTSMEPLVSSPEMKAT